MKNLRDVVETFTRDELLWIMHNYDLHEMDTGLLQDEVIEILIGADHHRDEYNRFIEVRARHEV